MTDKMQPPRTTSRSSPTTGLLVLIAALGLVGSLLYSQPITRAYRWIAYAVTRLPLDAYNNRVTPAGLATPLTRVRAEDPVGRTFLDRHR